MEGTFFAEAVRPRFKIHVIDQKLGDHGSSKRHFIRYNLSFSLNPCLFGIIFISTI